MNRPEGYVPMVDLKDSNHDVPIPRDISDGDNHFNDCPWAAWQSQQAEVVGNNELP
jgi:hypothetical protein